MGKSNVIEINAAIYPKVMSIMLGKPVENGETESMGVVKYDDGTVEIRKKYNGQNLLGNLLVCAGCGASFRRRTERGKVVYRCATRIEKGRDACKESPTIEEEWVKRELGKKVYGGEYDEKMVRERVERVKVLKNEEMTVELR